MQSILDRVIPQETQAVKADAFDRATFTDLKKTANTLSSTEKEGSESLKTFGHLMQDVFSSLYKYSPQVRQPGELKPSHRVNHGLINKAMETEQWGQLRNYTKLDEVNSAMATVTIAKSLIETIQKEMKEEADLTNQCLAAQDAADNAQSKAQSLQDIAGQAKGATKAKYTKQANQATKAAAEAQQQAQGLTRQLDEALPGVQQKLRQMMRTAENEALKEIRETSEMLEAWGTEPGQVQKLPPEKRIALAQKLRASEKMKKLARMVGRMRRLAVHAQKTKIKHGYDEVYDIERGADLSKVIPSELALLNNPLTKLDFERKFTEKSLMQYALRGTERAGKGPIIALIDNSGSMSNKELWAKAVALGLLEIATMQRRDFGCVMFGSASDPLDVTIIKKGEKNIIEKVLHIAEYFYGGGTDFEKPIDKGLELVQAQEFKKADIVMITDGERGVSQGWLDKTLKAKKEKEVRIISILTDYGTTSPETVKKFSDMVTLTSELTDDQASEIFGGV